MGCPESALQHQLSLLLVNKKCQRFPLLKEPAASACQLCCSGLTALLPLPPPPLPLLMPCPLPCCTGS